MPEEDDGLIDSANYGNQKYKKLNIFVRVFPGVNKLFPLLSDSDQLTISPEPLIPGKWLFVQQEAARLCFLATHFIVSITSWL